MRFEGLLIKESLKDESVLDEVEVTKVETWNINDPPIWTAMYFVGDLSQVDHTAEKLSQVLHPGWYCNIATLKHSIVVFPGNVFKYPRGEEGGQAKAQEHGRSLGLPEDQLDWGEDFPLS